MASTISAGVGRSGSPMPRLITSTPASRFAAILRSSSANAYGGIRSSRLLGLTRGPSGRVVSRWLMLSAILGQLVQNLLAETPREHGERPAGQVHAQVLPHVHVELAPVEHHAYAPLRRGAGRR